jgi:acetyl/propionyl-CoA carboxylase alpha subunit/acetyl-CoA carboxylase carboxyltransferase component
MFRRVLIANRGEVAIRVARACADLEIESVAIYARDDAEGLHVVKADAARPLDGEGTTAYLDGDAIISAAVASLCDAIHPGYGFLSESAEFARNCAEAGITFIGPPPDTLNLFGDKARALAHAASRGVPVARSTNGVVGIEDARRFMTDVAHGVMIKAAAGGGGRGMRAVRDAADFENAWQRCTAEAKKAFGHGELYVEELIGRSRHIEVQIIGDQAGNVTHLFERECSVQRRFQKIVEIAPSPWLSESMRKQLLHAALRIVANIGYVGLGTVEFLVEIDPAGRESGRFWFIEMNPRLQVEHTVTEEIAGVDLVQTQLRLAAGASLTELCLSNDRPEPTGFAVQLRISMERIGSDGIMRPSDSKLAVFEPPAGLGTRIETAAHVGYSTNLNYDPLMAKVIVRSPSKDFSDAARRAYRALCEFDVGDADTNLPFLRTLLRRSEFKEGLIDTRFVETHANELYTPQSVVHPKFRRHIRMPVEIESDTDDIPRAEDGCLVYAPMQGRLELTELKVGDFIRPGQVLAVLEAMKMEHPIVSEKSGNIREILKVAGDVVRAGTPLFVIDPTDEVFDRAFSPELRDTDGEASLDLLKKHQAALLDDSRPEAVARQRDRDALTARERVDLLCDSESFTEFGSLVHVEHATRHAPADGVIAGTARVDGRPVAVFAQDFTVFGGSAGHLGSAKIDRVLALSLANGIPLVMLLDGGGHRIQDGQNSRSYAHGAATFQDFARLSGWVPVVSAVLGAGFAANTNYSGLADLVIMLRGRATMGLAGPALVKAGTGEDITTQALGGASVQVDQYGLADIGVQSEPAAIKAIRAFLSYLPTNAKQQAPRVFPSSNADDPERAAPLLNAVPANTRRNYDVLPIVKLIADPDTVFEIKPTFARNIVTTLARIDGRPVGFVANQALHAAGMLDSPSCEKAAHFVAMCDAFGLPLIYLIDVPGFSIGSDAERTMLGRRSAKLIYELGHATVPRISIVMRKGYGLGYVAMGGGRSFDADAALAWPTAEICAMSVEGSVDVAYRSDYENHESPKARRQELIDEIRSKIGSIQAAAGFGIDEIIDPRTTRARLIEILERVPPRRDARQPPKYRSIGPI